MTFDRLCDMDAHGIRSEENVMARATIVSFWHGPLSWLEHLSMRSFVSQGHPVEIYSYDELGALPEGVRRRDANEVVPQERLVFYKGHGTPGVFSDLFRMSLLKQQRGTWSDLDVVCVRPIPEDLPYIFGYERTPRAAGRGGSINGAVLYIPHDAPLLDDLLSVFDKQRRPLLEPHLPFGRRMEVAVKRLFGNPVEPEHMQYGATGPFALTHFVRKHGLESLTLPQQAFYPVPYRSVPELLRPGASIEDFVTPRTLGVHIWRSQLTDRGRKGIAHPPSDSALDKLCRAHGSTTK